MIRPVATALWVPAGVAAVLGIAAFVGPPESVVRERPGQDEPVVRSTLVCPYVGGEPRASSHIGVLPLGGAPGEEAAEPEPVDVQALTGPDEEPATLFSATAAGALTAAEVETDDASGYAVRAVGVLAPGLAAEQTMAAPGPDLRGLVTGRCTGPAREHWFVGGSGEVGRRGRLVLSNPTSVPAVVDVSVWDESGPVDAPATQDIAVPARGQQILLLDALDPGAERIGVHVSASQGRVAAALEVRETDELVPQGVTFVPTAAAPSTDIVVPGVPAHGERTLRILAPGDTDAIVSLRLLGPEGPFSPVDQNVVTVTGGTVLEVPIGEGAGEVAVSVALESDEPVTASVRVVDAPSDELPDLAYTAATEPLAGAAPALLGRAGDGPDDVDCCSALSASVRCAGSGVDPRSGRHGRGGADGRRRGGQHRSRRGRRGRRSVGDRRRRTRGTGHGRGHPRDRRQRRRRCAAGPDATCRAGGLRPGARGRRRAADRPRSRGADRPLIRVASVVGRRPVQGVDVVGLHPEQLGHLFGEDIAHEEAQLPGGGRAGLDRPAVDHDPRWQRAGGGERARQRYPVAVPVVEHGDVLDRELDRGELLAPPPVQAFDGLDDKLVEAVGPAARQGRIGRSERPSRPAAVPIPAHRRNGSRVMTPVRSSAHVGDVTPHASS